MRRACVLGGPLGFGHPAWGAEEVDAALVAQFREVAASQEQPEPVREASRRHHADLRGMFRRLGQRGGDTGVCAARALRRMASGASREVAEVLTAAQPRRFERHLALRSERFMARNRRR